MKKTFFLLLAVLSLELSAQTTVGGVTLPETVQFENETLTFNGAGVREKFWMDMYAGALYLENKKSDENAILSAEEPMAIKLHILSKMITSQRMIDAVNEGFESATNGNTASISSEIDQFIGYFKEEITKGDVFDLVYLPAKGVVIYKNKSEKGTIEGKEFKKALFGIWLSNKPADDGLKNDMLGK